jgi:hypothetical protein
MFKMNEKNIKKEYLCLNLQNFFAHLSNENCYLPIK